MSKKNINFNEDSFGISPKLTSRLNGTSGDRYYTKKVTEWFKHKYNVSSFLLTTSCTHALEMTAILMDIKEGDEIIAPSYTFVSSVNAFVLRGAKIKFVDIHSSTMNINENLIESAITSKTRAIVVVHYAGVACNMDKIMSISERYKLYVIEDAAQAIFSKYHGKYLGTIGHFGTLSFHETKNYSMGEGGALLVNETKFQKRAEIIREKGTNRTDFLFGEINKYTWIDIGSSFLPSDILAMHLYTQLLKHKERNKKRSLIWIRYYEGLKDLVQIETPHIELLGEHNSHMFYIKVSNEKTRSGLISHLNKGKIIAKSHYVPLHSSPAGKVYGDFIGEDKFTTESSHRLLRLPIHDNILLSEVDTVINKIKVYFGYHD